MVQIFRSKSAGGIIAVILLGIAVHAHFFFEPVSVTSTADDGILFTLLAQYINANSTFTFVVFIALLLLQALLLNFILIKFKLFRSRSYSVAMSYILFSALIPQWHGLTSAFVANLFVIWLFYLLNQLHKQPSVKSLAFNIGLLVAFTYLIYIPLISLIVFALFALAMLRPFKIKEWLILIIGCLTPFYFLVSYLYLTDELYLVKNFIPIINTTTYTHFPIIFDEVFLIKAGYGLFVFLLGLIHLSIIKNRMLIHVKRYWNLMLAYLIFTLILPFIFPHATIGTFIISAVPLAAFGANLFIIPQRNLWMVNLMLLIFLAIIFHTNQILIKI